MPPKESKDTNDTKDTGDAVMEKKKEVKQPETFISQVIQEAEGNEDEELGKHNWDK